MLISTTLNNFHLEIPFSDLKNLMINVAIRGELNSAFAMLAHVSPNVLSSASELSETLPRHLPPDIVLLRAVIYSDQVRNESMNNYVYMKWRLLNYRLMNQ